MSICKKHGKERNVICTGKPSSRGGKAATAFEYVGCEDCKAGLPATKEAPPKRNRSTKAATKTVETKKTVETPPSSPKARSIGERFGFKF
jgi:hypothetical protein